MQAGLTLSLWMLLTVCYCGAGVSDSWGEGLTGYYYKRATKNGPIVSGPHDHKVVDKKIDFATATWDWAPFGMQDQFSVNWKGWIYIEKGGPHVFATFSEDGSSLYLDGMKVVDNMSARHEPVWTPGSILLGEGYHKIEIIYFHWKDSSGMGLYWDTGQGVRIVPSDVLFPEDFDPPAFKGARDVS